MKRSAVRASPTSAPTESPTAGLGLSARSGAGGGATMRTVVTGGTTGAGVNAGEPAARVSSERPASRASSEAADVVARAPWKDSDSSAMLMIKLRIISYLAIAPTPSAEVAASTSGTGHGERRLDHELIDKQEWHAGFEIVEQLLQLWLVNLATGDHAEKSRSRLRTLQIKLSRQHVAAEFRHRTGHALQQRRTSDGDRRAFQKWRPVGVVTSLTGPRTAAGLWPSSWASMVANDATSSRWPTTSEIEVTTANNSTTTRPT